MATPKSFDDYIREAESWTFSGWDFSSLKGRWSQGSPPWDYVAKVSSRLSSVQSLLDIGTGGGELLSSLQPLPKSTYATEGYPPNATIAKQRLKPFGAEVIETWSEDNSKKPQIGSLPFKGNSIDMVINRHESFIAKEVFRVLKLRGIFITQQSGSDYASELNLLLDAQLPACFGWNLTMAVDQLNEAGFEMTDEQEAHITGWFGDIGAVVCYLKAVLWQIPDFTVEGYRLRLEKLHKQITKTNGLEVKGTPFYLEAIKEAH